MNVRRLVLSMVLGLSACAISGSSIAAEKTLLSLIPAEAPVVVQVRSLPTIRDHLTALLRKSLSPRDVMQLDPLIAQLFVEGYEGHTLAGIADDGNAILALTKFPENPGELFSNVVLVAEVDDFEAFCEGLLGDDSDSRRRAGGDVESANLWGLPVYLTHRDQFAIVTLDRDTIDEFSEPQAGGGLAGVVPDDLSKRLADCDLGILACGGNIRDQIGEQGEEFRRLFETGFDQAMEQQSVDPRGQALIKVLRDYALQLVGDVEYALIEADIHPEGVHMSLELYVVEGSETSAFLAGGRQSSFAELEKMPADQLVFTGNSLAGGNEAFKPLLRAINGAVGESPALVESFRLENKAKSTLQISAAADREESTGISLEWAENPKFLVDRDVALFTLMPEGGDLLQGYVREQPLLEREAESYRGFTFHHVHVQWDLERSARAFGDDAGGAFSTRAAIMKLPEEQHHWFAADGVRYVDVNAESWVGARRMLDAYFEGDDTIGETERFKAARKRMPAECSFLYFEDASIWVDEWVDGMIAAGALPPWSRAADRGPRSGMTGMAASIDGRKIGIDLWMPGELISQVREVMTPILPK